MGGTSDEECLGHWLIKVIEDRSLEPLYGVCCLCFVHANSPLTMMEVALQYQGYGRNW